ncbi:DnaJ C-terminal domain-containing protein [uncultured Tateyamaria sp.]|uniref:DnaJ C-terminal domain-containing protein n=1 Tax=uncultured Tateyamaria sp. TaxID=455651 RepID=UPI002601EA86|nr:DnaJ C-terminal domain-containing protein [uncultured Tateyamaria sp.]
MPRPDQAGGRLMEFKDYYKVLGVARDAGADEIKKAFRKAARKYHPDIAPGPEAEAKFKEVNEAYEVLKDPERRAAYDQLGREPPRHDGRYQPPPGWDSGFSFSQGGPREGETFSDFFETLFRRGADPATDRGTGWGADSHGRIEITIEEAYEGAARTLSLRSPVLSPDGEVTLETRAISVHVPKGVTEGQHIRLPGEGAPEAGAGDLFLEIVFAPHPIYRPDGRDLYLDLPIAPWEAALGGHVTMPTPDGRIDLRIPKNARTGQKLRLKGKGLPGQPRGDIYATLKIVNPKADTSEARAFFERMAREMPFDPRAHLGG